MHKLLQVTLSLVAAIFMMSNLHAQPYYNQTSSYLKYNSVWTFYNHINLNFNTGTVSSSSISSGLDAEGCASVADPNTGALMFYSDGGTCWSGNGIAMPNGNGLLGNAMGSYSTAQGVCIVPVPGASQQYYLFSLQSTDGTTVTSYNLYYSIVDMSLNNGLGDIVVSSKNTLLDGVTMLGEAMLAIQGDNCDVWLLLHKRQTADFKAFHITSGGINPNAILSSTGAQIQGTATFGFGGFQLEQDAYEQCTMTISPNRQKLAVSVQNLGGVGVFPIISTTGRSWGGLLCDFDPSTGMVSNAMLIDTATQYSAAFSSDNSKLYYTTVDQGGASSTVHQVDISSNDSATIVGTATVVGTPIVSDNLISIRAYNDTIYVMNPAALSLDRINKPNLSGAACNYQSMAISFPGATSMGASLPAEVVAAANPDTLRSRVMDTTICQGWANGISIQAIEPSLSNDFTWNTGSSTSQISIDTAGTYWVRYGNSCHSRVDTFVIKGSNLNPVILENNFILSTTLAYDTYQWCLNNVPISGATSSNYTAIENGVYTVIVSDLPCTVTSAPYNLTGIVGIGYVADNATQIKIFPNPTMDMIYIKTPIPVNVQIIGLEGRIINTIINPRQISMSGYAPGIYMFAH